MLPSKIARAAAQHRTPLISFLGKRTVPQNIDHTPHPHPQSGSGVLPNSFAEYRKTAIQHGPLATQQAQTTRGSIQASVGEFFDRNQLPRRFWRMTLSQKEMEIIESGGAAAWA